MRTERFVPPVRGWTPDDVDWYESLGTSDRQRLNMLLSMWQWRKKDRMSLEDEQKVKEALQLVRQRMGAAQLAKEALSGKVA